MSILSPELIEQQISTYPELLARELSLLLGTPLTLPQGIHTVYAVGNGDSYHACLCAASFFAQHAQARYCPQPAYTFLTHTLPRLAPDQAAGTLVICVSASGGSGMAVNILNASRARGAHTLALTGKESCAMNEAAESAFPAVIAEKGRTPGLRTFCASYIGLLRIAAALAGQEQALLPLQATLPEAAQKMDAWLEVAHDTAEYAAAWDWPSAVVTGSGALEGCARFSAAKLAEGAGLFAAGQEAEEWCHVESMTYPLTAPLILLQGGENERAQAIKQIDTAHRAGRRVLLLSAEAVQPGLVQAEDAALFIDCAEETLWPLLLHVPCALLAQRLAEKAGRGMFLSDQPFRLF